MSDTSSHYTVLARRFRPQTFEEVVGQQHVGQSLLNAIRSSRVAHAYLFTGSRGVGKTSMARILAKALNCPAVKDAIPCNECEICRGISTGSDVDVLEIDGASNRGIDDIRSLRANVNVKSMRSKFKIYIIDEVHMLTREAFNALLKTLEEPPPTVKFVFCTTEPNKVPDTILSRCQRFDFSTIETANIISRLQEIAQAEGFDVDPSALELVARRAAGSMRDSQSLFDQLLAFGGEKITAEDVHRLFGTAADDRLIELIDALIQRQREIALKLLDTMLAEGVQLGELMNQLLHTVRDLMIIASGADGVGLLGVSEGQRAELTRQAKDWGLQTSLAAMEILAEARNRMFRAGHARTIVETALIRISLLEELDRLADLIQEFKQAGTAGKETPPAKGVSRHAGPGTEKKTPEGEKTEAERASQPENQPVPVEFRPGLEVELLSQIVANMNDASATHLKHASLAISGPKRLDIIFPESYHFSKQYCERPEILGPLEKLVADITGREIRISLRLQKNSQQEQHAEIGADNRDSGVSNGSGSSETQELGQKAPHSENDPFVKRAEDVFGGTVIRKEGISVPAPQQE